MQPLVEGQSGHFVTSRLPVPVQVDEQICDEALRLLEASTT
jgi:hypothetical protein